METVYLETTFVSYLVAKPSQDALMAYRQGVSRLWWNTRRNVYHCVGSGILLKECSAGDVEEATKRLSIVETLPLFELTPASLAIGEAIIYKGLLPATAITDAQHIGIAAEKGIKYLVSWNYRHLVNPSICKRVEQLCESMGFRMPLICTPESLMED